MDEFENEEVPVFDVSDIAERAVFTAVEVVTVAFPSLFLAFKGGNGQEAVVSVAVAAGAAALSVVKSVIKQYLAAKKAKVQF